MECSKKYYELQDKKKINIKESSIKKIKKNERIGGKNTIKRKKQIREYLLSQNDNINDDIFDTIPIKKYEIEDVISPKLKLSVKRKPNKEVTPLILRTGDINTNDKYIHAIKKQK